MKIARIAKNVVLIVVLGGIAAAVTIYMRKPVLIRTDAVKVAYGPMMVAIEEEGETRARDQFTIAAPIEGELRRISLREGDRVPAGQVVAVLRPSPVAAQPRVENRARIAAAESLEREAGARVEQAIRELELAKKERMRIEKLARSGDVAAKTLDQAQTAENVAAQQLAAARARKDAARHDVEAASALLVAVDPPPSALLQVRSPVSGRVLAVIQQSERVVAPGTPLLTLGDAKQLEVVVDVLSSDAVRIRPKDLVILEQWGGGYPLHARVRLVEPLAFTKISALGVEEKRVHVIADFDQRPDALGVGYRVEAKIVAWSSDRVLKIPASAAFRKGKDWAVFLIRDNTTYLQIVEVGHRNDAEIEILSGLKENDVVVRRPERELEEGTKVEAVFS